MRAINQTRNKVLVEDGKVASSPWARLVGLLGHSPLEPGQGLLLRGEKAIHTFGMTFPIDVLFLDRTGTVVHLLHSMPPLRASRFVKDASDVLELASGIIFETGTTLGDHVLVI